jgi:hypothetical protein
VTKKKIILLTLIVLLSASVLYLALVPIDLSERTPYIKSRIEQYINGTVDMEGISLQVLPYPRIRIENFTLRDARETLIRSETLKMGVSLVPLFSKHVAIRSLVMERGDVLLRRDKDGRLSIQNIIKEKIFTVSLRSLSLEGGRIKLVDEKPEEPAFLEMTGVNAHIYPTISGFTYRAEGSIAPGGRLSFSGEGHIDPEGEWALSGTLALREIDIEPLEPYLKGLVHIDLVQGANVSGLLSLDTDYSITGGDPFKGKGLLKGTLELKDTALDMPKIFLKSIRLGRGSADLDLTWGPEELVFALHDGRLSVFPTLSDEGFVLTGSLKLSGPGPGPFLDLEVSSTPIEAGTFLDLLTRETLPEKLTAVLADIEHPGGKIGIKDLTFSGRLGVLEWKDYLKALSLGIELEGLSFKHQGLEKPFSAVTGHLTFRDGTLSAKDIRGRYGSGFFKGLQAEIRDITEEPSYTFSLDAMVEAGDVLEGVKKSQLLNIPTTLEVKGETSLSLHMEGVWKKNETIKYSGNVGLEGVDLSYNSLPLPLETLTGEAVFDTGAITIAWLKGRTGDLDFTFKGQIKASTISIISLKGKADGSDFAFKGEIKDYRSSQPFFDLDTDVTLAPETVPLLLKGHEYTVPAFTRPVYLKGHLKGKPNSILLESSIDLTDTDIKYGRLIEKVKGIRMNLDSTIRVQQKHLVIEESLLSFGNSTMSVKGTIFRDRPGYELEYNSKGILIADIAEISPYFVKDYQLRGNVSFAIKGTREAENKIPQYEGKMTIKDWHIKTPFLANPVTGTEMVSRFSKNTASVTIAEAKTGESSFSGKVDIVDISRGKIQFELLSPRINAADLLPTPAGADLEPFITGSGKLTVREGTAWGFTFKNFTTGIDISQKTISFPVNFTSHEGRVSGNVVYFRDPKETTLFKTGLKLSKLSLKPLIKELGAKRPILAGRLDAEVELEGKKQMALTSGLNGNVRLIATDGGLWEFIVLRKIFSIVNIVSISELFEREEGLPYKAITGSFTINDGVIRTKDLLLDSDSMRMSAIGKINSTAGSIKATLGLHPFVTIDKIISKIPLAGWIIVGDEKSTVTMYYRIKGPLKDPEVTPQPAKSIEKNILDIFKRVLKTPIKAVTPDVPVEKNEREKEKTQ